MKSQNQILTNTILYVSIFLLTVLSSQIKAEEKQWVVFRDNIPQEIERFHIKMEFTQSSARFYDSSQQGIKSEEIEGSKKKDAYKHQLDFGAEVDGNQYVVMVKDSSDVGIISQNSERLVMAKVLRIKDKKKPETVKEGIISLHRDLELPLEVSPEQLSVPFNEPIKGTLEINLYSNNPPVYEGRCRTVLYGTLSGSTSTEAALLDTSIACRSSLELKDRYLSLSLTPFDEQMAPAAYNGRISDTLMLGSAKLVVEKMASDSSELVIALLDGDLVQARKQDDTLVTIGKPFPDFARVELVKRQLVTLDDLIKEASVDGYVVLIFGDFKQAMPPQYFGGRPPMRGLSLDEMMISEILKKDTEKPVVITFICQQLSLADLYEKWLGHDPEFHILSDFSNPLKIQFLGISMEPHMMPPQDREETLRGNLKLDIQKVVTGLVDGNGDLIYLNTDAGNELAGSLVQINKLIREGKKAQLDQDQY